MRTPRLKPSAVALAVALAGLAPAGVVSAQQTEQAQETVLDEIVVKGIRRSLRQSMDIKRGEDGVVDAITAEDIGKFPDANLAESLQRITGVSIDRQNNEGNQISVRGLGPSFNLVTLNGRQMPVASSPEQENIASATQSRAFNFSEIAAESVSGVNVYKTVRANHATGGIGATVDIRTAKPFDFDGTKTLLSVAGIHDSSVEEGSSLTPEIGALFATQLSDSFAILLNGSYSEREFTDKEERTNGWQRITPTGDANEFAILGQVADLSGVSQLYRPNTNISEVAENERKRLNGQLVLQFRPSDNLEATIDYTLSRYEVSEKRFQTGMFGDPVNHGVQSLTFDQNGTFTSYAFSGAADFLSYENELNIENDSIGLNLEWQVNDKLSLFFDAHTSESESQPDGERNDLLFLLQGAQNVNFAFNYGSDAPFSVAVDDSNAQTQLANNVPGLLAFLGGPSQTLQLNSFLDPAGFAPLGTFARNISILNEVDQAQVGGTWEFGSDTGLISADFGASKTDYTVNTNSISSNFVFQGIGVDPATFSSSCATAFCPIDSPLRGQIGLGGGTGLGGFGTIARVSSPSSLAEAFPIPLSSIDPAVARTRIEEESTAFYLNLNFELQLGDMPAKLAVGGRYEDTDVTGVSFQNLPLALRTSSPTEQEVLQSTEEIPFTLQGNYSEFLPAIDLSIETSENTVVRASYGRSLARPDLNALRPALQIGDTRPFGPFNAGQGNPDLEPYLADNFDMAFEWYYAPDSYAAINYFKKDIENYIGTRSVVGPVLNASGNPLTDPSARFVQVPVVGNASDPVANFNISEPFNSGDASLDGFEFAVQHLFADSGFGVQANYTVVDSDAEFDANAFVQTVNLIGLSDSANLVGFYENDKFQVRAALNWRDSFLFSENQLRVQGEPVFFDSYTQVDISASYNYNDSISFFAEILNLTGEDQVQYGRFRNQVLLKNDQDPRFTLGVKADF